ncbi:MAG: ABC transporter permease subunit [Armatimonadota bacterium]
MLRQVPDKYEHQENDRSVPKAGHQRAGQIPSPLESHHQVQVAPSHDGKSDFTITLGRNPIVGLAIRQWLGAGGAKGSERFTRLIILVIVLCATVQGTFIEPAITATVLAAVNCLLVLLSGAASIALERDNKTWDALRLSRLGTTRIILGKWFSAAFPAIITQALFALLLLITPVAKTIGVEKWLLIQGIMGASTLFATALSVYVSSTAQSTQKAQVGTGIAAFISLIIGNVINGLVGSTNPVFAVGLLITPEKLRSFVDAPVPNFPNWIMTAITIVGSAVLYLMTLGQLSESEEEVVPTSLTTEQQRLVALRATHAPELRQMRTTDSASGLEMTTAALSLPIQALLLRLLSQIPLVSEHPLIGKELRSILIPAGTHSRAGSLRWTLIGGVVGMMFVFTILTAGDGADFRQNAALRVYLGIAAAIWMTVQTAATSIPKEREKQTWNAMLLSRISLREIVISKAVAACAPGLLIITAILPMLVIGLIASGAAWHALFTAPALMVGMLGIAGSIGMLLGSINRNSRSASLQAALLTMIVLGSPFLASGFPGFTDVLVGSGSLPTVITYIGGSLGFTALVGWLAMLAAKRGPREFDA